MAYLLHLILPYKEGLVMVIYAIQLENDEFHKKLGGGLPAGTIALIRGEHGSGKSVICQRITYGLLKNNVKVTYISTQLTTIDFIKQMSSLGYEIFRYIVNRQLLFIPVYPLIQEPKIRMDYIQRLMKARELFDNDVIIIDCLSSLVKYDIEKNKNNIMIKLMSFFKRLSALGKVIIMTALDELEKDVIEEIESASSFVAETSIKRIGTELKNVMIIKKYNLAVGQYSKQITFRVEPKIGLVVEIAAVT